MNGLKAKKIKSTVSYCKPVPTSFINKMIFFIYKLFSFKKYPYLLFLLKKKKQVIETGLKLCPELQGCFVW